MHAKKFVYIAAAVALFAILVGCDDTPEQNRSVVTIESVNGDFSPLTSDVITNGSIYPDLVNFIFRNRPYSRIISTAPDAPFGDFLITRYRVEWQRTDGGSPALPAYESNMSLQVPTEKDADVNVIIVTWENKANPPLAGITGEVRMNATITFYGHETGTDRETEVVANLGVIFADFADTP
jgi:hypothetical protein